MAAIEVTDVLDFDHPLTAAWFDRTRAQRSQHAGYVLKLSSAGSETPSIDADKEMCRDFFEEIDRLAEESVKKRISNRLASDGAAMDTAAFRTLARGAVVGELAVWNDILPFPMLEQTVAPVSPTATSEAGAITHDELINAHDDWFGNAVPGAKTIGDVVRARRIGLDND